LRNYLYRFYRILISEWFSIILLCCMMVLVVSAVLFPPVPAEVLTIPSMESLSFSRWAYVVGMPDHYVFLNLVILGLLYLFTHLLRSIPRWKNQISFTGKFEDFQDKSLYIKEKFDLQDDLELSAHQVRKELINRGFHVREEQAGKEIYFTAEKHRINRWAGIIIHAGILLLLMGALICGLKGMREDVKMHMGDEEQVFSEPLFMQLNNEIEPEYYSGTKKLYEYRADIAVTEIDRQKTSILNLISGKPAWFKGFRCHLVNIAKTLQDVRVEMRIHGYRERTRMLRLSFGKDVRIRGTRLIIRLDKFVPDFIISDGKVTTRGPAWNNPAVKVSVFSGRTLKFSEWLFEKYKSTSFFKKQKKWYLQLVELTSGYYAGVRISRSPGILIVWVGMCLIVAGLCLKCFFSYRAIWILVDGRSSMNSIMIAGESSREHIHFSEYFKKVVKNLKSSQK